MIFFRPPQAFFFSAFNCFLAIFRAIPIEFVITKQSRLFIFIFISIWIQIFHSDVFQSHAICH